MKQMTNPTATALLLSFLLSANLLSAQKESSPGSSKIVYVDQVSCLDDLFAKFRGQIIYVDYWGSWCGSREAIPAPLFNN
jgi:thiol-disulfide isomerase/thioredoxin